MANGPALRLRYMHNHSRIAVAVWAQTTDWDVSHEAKAVRNVLRL